MNCNQTQSLLMQNRLLMGLTVLFFIGSCQSGKESPSANPDQNLMHSKTNDNLGPIWGEIVNGFRVSVKTQSTTWAKDQSNTVSFTIENTQPGNNPFDLDLNSIQFFLEKIKEKNETARSEDWERWNQYWCPVYCVRKGESCVTKQFNPSVSEKDQVDQEPPEKNLIISTADIAGFNWSVPPGSDWPTKKLFEVIPTRKYKFWLRAFVKNPKLKNDSIKGKGDIHPVYSNSVVISIINQ